MRTIALVGLGLLVALIIAGGAHQVADAFTGPTAAEMAADYARAERIYVDTELYAVRAPWRALLVEIVLTVTLTGVLAFLYALGALFVRRYHLERMPDARGLLPVLASDQHTAQAALAGFHTARIEEARRPIVPTSPATLTYAPHISHHAELEQHGNFGMSAGELPQVGPPAPPAGAVPRFSELLDQGRIGRGNPLLLGYDRDTGAAVEGSWLDLYSCAVGGLSGSGKSWTACFLAAQAALHGARLIILDPHADNAESLATRLSPMAPRFVCEVADTPRAMHQAVQLVAGELERRKSGGRGEPWLFLADEFSALQRGELAEPLAQLVEALGQEGRKLGLYGMVCGQVWTATRAGGTELRDSLASAYVHRLRPAQARMLTGLTAADLPGDLISLPAGTAYLLSTAGELRPVVIPQVDTRDIARVAELASGTPVVSLESPKPAQGSTASVRAEAARALQLFREGLDLPGIVLELRGLDSRAGRKYQEAAKEVQRLMREALS